MLRSVNDGYVRLTLPSFHALRFHQHMCLKDEDLLQDLWSEGIPAIKAGYYELVSNDTEPAVSIGCAWHLTAESPHIRVGNDDISSNVMLLDAGGADIGAQDSCVVIKRWLCNGPRKQNFELAVIQEA